jgi:oligoribonuclease NrnB/cAMP/cGMP phosphodiesterase (DHH superfamily)
MLIIFHKSCPDGWAAAFIAKKRYPEAELLAQDHGLNPPYAEVEGKDVLVLDFSWRTRDENIRLSKLADSFHIIDHHKTAQEVLRGLDFATFDMNRSGAGLTWDYLFGTSGALGSKEWNPADPFKTLTAQPRPWWVNYVEDRDLWNKKLICTEEVNAYIMTLPFTFEAWQELEKITWEEAARRGAGALAHVEHYVREGIKQAQKGTLNGHPALIVNALYMNISELAGELSKQSDGIGIGYFERGDGKMQFSLRSRNDLDVSEIAKSFGGGGHKNAAGFQMSVYDGRLLVDQILGRIKFV